MADAMADEADPAPRTVLVQGVRGMPEFHLQLLFENQKRTGGGDMERIEILPDGDGAVITFRDTLVARRVLDRKEISVEGRLLTISEPQPAVKCDPCCVIVENIPSSIDSFMLEIYFENEKRSGGGPIVQLDRENGSSAARITYQDEAVASRVLAWPSGWTLPGGTALVVRLCPLPSAIQVRDVVEGDRSMLELYFESPRSGGRDVRDVRITDNVAVITFEDPEVVPQVLKRKHSFGDSRQLTVQPYIPELHPLPDTSRCGPDPCEPSISSPAPDPGLSAPTTGPVDSTLKIPLKMSGILGFLKDTKKGSSWVLDGSSQCHYDVDWGRSGQTEICVVYSPQNGGGTLPTAQWIDDCRQEFHDLFLDVSELEIKVEHSLLDAVEIEIEKERSGESTVFCELNKSTEMLTLTGFEYDVLQRKDTFERLSQKSGDIADNNSSLTEPHTSSTMLETEVSLEAGIIRLLHLTRHVEYMKGQDADLDVCVRNNDVVLRGTEEHLQRGYNLLYDHFVTTIIQEEFRMTNSKFGLLNNPAVLRLVETMITEDKLLASLDVDTRGESVIVYALTQQDVTHVENMVLGIVEKNINISGSDKRGIMPDRWQHIKSELQRDQPDHLVIEETSQQLGQARVICTPQVLDAVNTALKVLEDTRTEELVVQTAIPTAVLIRSHFTERLTSITDGLLPAFPDTETSITSCDPSELPGFLIKGSEASTEEAAIHLRSLLSGVLRNDHEVRTPTMPQYFLSSESEDFLANLERQNKVICVVDDDDDRLLRRPVTESTPEARPESSLLGATAAPFPATQVIKLAVGHTITVLAEDLTTCDLDAVVVPATNRLEHTLPTVVHLTQQGGPNISKACSNQRQIFSRDPALGTTCRTEAGQLKCGHIIHMVTTRGDLLQTEDSFLSACIAGALEDIKYLGLKSAAIFVCENKPKIKGDLSLKLQNLAMALIDFLAFDADHKVNTLHLVVMDHAIQGQLYQVVEQLFTNFGIEIAGPSETSTEAEGAVGGALEAELGAVGGATASPGEESGAVGGASDQTSGDTSVPETNPDRVTLSVYGMSDNDSVNKSVTMIKDKCSELCDSQMLTSPEEEEKISKLSPQQCQLIQDLEEKYRPWIVLELKQEEHLNYVEVCGRRQQVFECVREVRALLSASDTAATSTTDGVTAEDRDEVEGAVGGVSSPPPQQGDDILAGSMEIQEQFQWQRRLSSGNYDTYPRDISALLEIAYKDDQPTAEFEDYDGKRYSVDFHAMKQLALPPGGKTTAIRRKGQQNGPSNAPSLPVSWTPMGSSNLLVVVLEKNDQEYQDLEEAFRATCPNYTIKQIERIQNPGLYHQYQTKLQLLNSSSDEAEGNERRLYHGTAVETVPNINRNGFNRGYCGKNATMYGSGVYFAREAAYSARRQYSPEKDGKRYMYQSLVATGTFTQGNQSYKEPPPKDPSNPTVRYDSVVDRVNSPDMFVIFHDTQAYPEYLITFI